MLWSFGGMSGPTNPALAEEQQVHVRIYRPARSTMQAGLAAARHWVLEFPPETACTPDPLMGWASASDTRMQARLRFRSLAEAVRFAKDHGWDVDLQGSRAPRLVPKNYAENFAWKRKVPRSH
jgi:hypothetical protein